MDTKILQNQELFSEHLFAVMKPVSPVVEKMELYEFRYCLNNIVPENCDWTSVKLETKEETQKRISTREFFDSIQIKPKVDGRIVLDKTIEQLTQMLFVGLVKGVYEPKWVNEHFYFDPRGFNFLVRSIYLTDEIKTHLGDHPYKTFDQKQKKFEGVYEVGYLDFKDANSEIDQLFINSILTLVASKGAPIVLAIAGPTAAGKTEIVDRLRLAFEKENKKITAIELDNFLTDRDQREERGIGSFGKDAIHFELFKACINNILNGQKVSTPRYDFIFGTSSHDLQGNLKPSRTPIEIEPADIIFIEGNSPFLLPEIAPLIGIKVVYITDDPVRLKRKWRRDIDYRKKYDPYYLRNRYFKEQPPMAIKNYRPQLMACDIFVDTTGAAMWVTPDIKKNINK